MITREFLSSVCTHSKGTLACVYSAAPDKLQPFVDVYLEGLVVKLGILAVILFVSLIATFLIFRKFLQVLAGDTTKVDHYAKFTVAFTATLISLSLSLLVLMAVVNNADQVLIWSGPLETLVFQKL